MKPSSLSKWATAALCALCVGVGPSCAEERDPIDRVQVGALPKSFFVGENLQDPADDPEFYFRTTVADVQAGAGSEELFTASDAQPTVRIRWEITEDKLIARLAYELISDTDHRGTTTGTAADAPAKVEGVEAPRRTNDGQVVAAFQIQKHFDIRREYNSQTGEEANVVGENDTDRPYYERTSFRVDWSRNLVTNAYDLDAFSQIGLYGAVTWDPVSFYVNDPKDVDAPVFDLPTGYFDVTNKALAAPQIIKDDEYGDYPACWLLGSYPQVSCNPSEVKLRLAFRKIVDTDYEPLDWDGRKMELFGYFTNDRFGYDRRYGIVDDRWHRFASRWNVFEKSHAEPVIECATEKTTPAGKSSHRDENQDGTDDECDKAGKGSRCDEFRHACTMPLAERPVKTTVWFASRGFPEDLFDGTKDVITEWSNAIRAGILAGRVAECRRVKGNDCESKMGWPKAWSDDYVPPIGKSKPSEVPAVFVLCHNPSTEKDDEACGPVGTSPRLGDLRYNVVNLIDSPQASSPWGIMVDAEDPLTGEKISGSVNQWGAVLDKAAGQLSDLVMLLNGEIAPDAFIAGQNVANWVSEQSRSAAKPPPVSLAEYKERMSAFEPKAMTPFATGTPKPLAKRGPVEVQHKARLQALAAAGKVGQGNAAITARFSKLKGSELEQKLITPEFAVQAGLDPNAPLTKDMIARASPFSSRSNPLLRKALKKRSLTGRSLRHSCRRDGPESDHLLSLARKAQRLFGTADPADEAAVRMHRDKITAWARKEYSKSVFAHEFGHSMGLRHNFAGTFDSLNYQNEYWMLRTKNGQVTAACKPGTTDGSACIGPRYNDPITDDEINGVINGYASSSVMDYPGDQALDMMTLGKYDRAAVRFGYGGVVDVWAEPGVSVKGSGDGQTKAFELTAFGSTTGLFGIYNFPQPAGADWKTMHYTAYASRFGLVGACGDDAKSALGSTCKGAPLDVVDYRELQDFAPDPDYAAVATTTSAVDGKGRVRRGYMFSSDEYSDSGNVPSFSYDAGADPYEQVVFLSNAYENRYVFDSFRRNRTTFNSEAVVARVQSHYLDAIQNIGKTFAFGMVLENDDPTVPRAGLLDDGNYGPLAMASTVAFDTFTRMLTRPEPGYFCSTATESCPNYRPPGLDVDIDMVDTVPVPSTTAYDFTLALGTGRYIHNDFDYGQGYWWGDYQKQVGSFYDKTWAIYYLSEAFDAFISNSREDFLDGRYKNVSFGTVYPTQVSRLFGSLMTGDLSSFAPWTETPGGGIPSAKLTYPSWRNPTTLGVRSKAAKIVDPAWGWNEQLYAMVWGTMLFPTSWSNGFIDDARIVARAGEAITWPLEETTTFFDPATGTAYRAHSTGYDKQFDVEHEKSIGARMLEWANTLVYEAYIVEVDAKGFYVLNDDATPKLKLDAKGKPQPNPDYPGGVAALKRYVVSIELMRQLVNTFVRPPGEILPQP